MARFQNVHEVKSALMSYSQHLSELPEDQLLSRENLEFIERFWFDIVKSSSDRYFKLLYNKGDFVDSILDFDGFSDEIVKYIIKKEELEKHLWNQNVPISTNPSWNSLKMSIQRKYNKELADDLILKEQIAFYLKTQNWKLFADYVEMKLKKHPPRTPAQRGGNTMGDTWDLNIYAWDVFLGCNDKSVLNRALKWSDLSIKLEQPEVNIQFLIPKPICFIN